MKKNVLGAVVFFSLLALAVLSMYIYAARTGSGHRLREFNRTAGYLEERIAALEKQRDLIGDTATALDGQAEALQLQAEDLEYRADELSRRAAQIDSEITNMRDLIGGAKESVRSPIFSLRGFRLTAGSGIVIIAFLAFIWLLYSSLRSRADEEDAFIGDVGRVKTPDDIAPVPGSVLEEEFPATVQEEEEPPPAGEADAGEDEQAPSSTAAEVAAGATERSATASEGEEEEEEEEEETESPPNAAGGEELPDKKGEQ